MGMREQAIEEVAKRLDGPISGMYVRASDVAMYFAERALTAEVALAEARQLLIDADTPMRCDEWFARQRAWLARNGGPR